MIQRRAESVRPFNANPVDIHSMPQPPSWMASAVCASVDPEMFFPDVQWSPSAAKAICADCPVAVKCLEYAMAFESAEFKIPDRHGGYGIYGGLTAGERKQLRATRRNETTTQQESA